jgi:hypothetical protein
MSRKQSRNNVPFGAPLLARDSEQQTDGCRHTNPGICAKHSMEGTCAFVRADGLCKAPPASWAKQHRKLIGQQGSK